MFSHTLIIIMITVGISCLAFSNQAIMARLLFWPPAIQERAQYDRFISYGFIHADGAHLIFNMITLFFFGRIMETFYRQFCFDMGFVLFYLGGLIFSILPSYLKNKNNPQWSSLGASGAISAVLFSYILFQPWAKIYVIVIPVPAIIFAVLYIGYTIWSNKRSSGNINHSAHLWGAAYGVITTIIVEPKIIPHFLNALL